MTSEYRIRMVKIILHTYMECARTYVNTMYVVKKMGDKMMMSMLLYIACACMHRTITMLSMQVRHVVHAFSH